MAKAEQIQRMFEQYMESHTKGECKRHELRDAFLSGMLRVAMRTDVDFDVNVLLRMRSRRNVVGQ